MPHVENKWTVGNITAIVAIVLGIGTNFAVVARWSAQIESKLDQISVEMATTKTELQRQIDIQTLAYQSHDVRIRATENGFVRLDEKTSAILETVREVRDALRTVPRD